VSDAPTRRVMWGAYAQSWKSASAMSAVRPAGLNFFLEASMVEASGHGRSAPAAHGVEHGRAWATMVEGRRCGGSPPPRSGWNAPARARSSLYMPHAAHPHGAPWSHAPALPRRPRRAAAPRVSRVGGTRPMHAPSARCTRTSRNPRKANRNARHGHCARYTPSNHTPYELVVFLSHGTCPIESVPSP